MKKNNHNVEKFIGKAMAYSTFVILTLLVIWGVLVLTREIFTLLRLL